MCPPPSLPSHEGDSEVTENHYKPIFPEHKDHWWQGGGAQAGIHKIAGGQQQTCQGREAPFQSVQTVPPPPALANKTITPALCRSYKSPSTRCCPSSSQAGTRGGLAEPPPPQGYAAICRLSVEYHSAAVPQASAVRMPPTVPSLPPLCGRCHQHCRHAAARMPNTAATLPPARPTLPPSGTGC